MPVSSGSIRACSASSASTSATRPGCCATRPRSVGHSASSSDRWWTSRNFLNSSHPSAARSNPAGSSSRSFAILPTCPSSRRRASCIANIMLMSSLNSMTPPRLSFHCSFLLQVGRLSYPARYERCPGRGVTRRWTCRVESSGKAPGTKVAPRAAHAARSGGEEPRSSIQKLRAEISGPARHFTATGQPATTMSAPSNEADYRWTRGAVGHRPLSRPRLPVSRLPVSEQDALLATKLHVPRPQPGFVPRPRLVEALGEGLARGLVVVCAPAGFGKTALLADWAGSARRAVAWLSLDTADNDPARFWRHVVAALDRACPGIAERAGPLLGPPP